jgi:type IV secretory pathway ATPase VirB11/archaellum biosynthesis ATPase
MILKKVPLLTIEEHRIVSITRKIAVSLMREMGRDAELGERLRAALREDPRRYVVGEMRT